MEPQGGLPKDEPLQLTLVQPAEATLYYPITKYRANIVDMSKTATRVTKNKLPKNSESKNKTRNMIETSWRELRMYLSKGIHQIQIKRGQHQSYTLLSSNQTNEKKQIQNEY